MSFLKGQFWEGFKRVSKALHILWKVLKPVIIEWIKEWARDWHLTPKLRKRWFKKNPGQWGFQETYRNIKRCRNFSQELADNMQQQSLVFLCFSYGWGMGQDGKWKPVWMKKTFLPWLNFVRMFMKSTMCMWENVFLSNETNVKLFHCIFKRFIWHKNIFTHSTMN